MQNKGEKQIEEINSKSAQHILKKCPKSLQKFHKKCKNVVNFCAFVPPELTVWFSVILPNKYLYFQLFCPAEMRANVLGFNYPEVSITLNIHLST